MRATPARLAGPGIVAGAIAATAAGFVLRTGADAGGEVLPGSTALAAALVAVAVALAATRLAGRLAERVLVGAGAVCAGAGLWLAAAEGTGMRAAGLVVAAAGFGPSLALGRLLAGESAEALHARPLPWPARDAEGHESRYVLFSRYWAAATAGCLGVFLAAMARPLEMSSVLRGTGTAAAVGGLAILLGPRRRGEPATGGIGVPDAPWARRSTAAAFALGLLGAGVASSGYGLLAGEWQRTPHGAAGVLAAAAGGALLSLLVGRWFHRLAQRRGAGRAGAIGRQLMIGGLAVLLGGLSFTYIGLILSWIIAAGALVPAAAGLDAATWAGLRPSTRRRVAARQVAGLALGAGLGAFLLAVPLTGRHDQARIAATSLACIAVGYLLARRCPPDDAAAHRRPAWSTTVPRTVEAGPGTPLLQVEGLGVAYDGVPVVSGVNLTVGEGSVVALLGTNGAGKTSTLRAVSGLEPAAAGRILYRGLDITRTPPTWRVGMGLQQIVGGEAVAGELTVEDNLRLFAHSVARDRVGAGIAAAFEQFPRLAERRSQLAATLSGGEKQMLALAKAFVTSPRLLLIDEFSLGLAPALVEELLPAVRRIAAGGTSVLLVEQSVDLACELADHVYVMEKGEIRHEGTPAELQAMGDLVRSVYLADTPGASGP